MPVNIVRLNPTQFAPGGGRRGRYVNSQPDRLMNELSLLNSRQGFQSGEGDKDRKLQMALALMGQKSSQRQFDASERRHTDEMGLMRSNYNEAVAARLADNKAREEQFDFMKSEAGLVRTRQEGLDAQNVELLEANRDLQERELSYQIESAKRASEDTEWMATMEMIGSRTNNMISASDIAVKGMAEEARLRKENYDKLIGHEVVSNYYSRRASMESHFLSYLNNPEKNKGDIDKALGFVDGMLRHAQSMLSSGQGDLPSRMAAVSLFSGNDGKGGPSLLLSMQDSMEQAAQQAGLSGHTEEARKIRAKAAEMRKIMIDIAPDATRAMDAYTDAIGATAQVQAATAANTKFRSDTMRFGVDKQINFRDEQNFDRRVRAAGGAPLEPLSALRDRPSMPNTALADPDMSELMAALEGFQTVGPPSSEAATTPRADTAAGLRGRRSGILEGINKRGEARATEGRNARELAGEQRKNFLIEEAILSGASDSELYDLIQRIEKPWTKSFSPSSIVGRKG